MDIEENESTGTALINLTKCTHDELKAAVNVQREVDSHILADRNRWVALHTSWGYPVESLISEGETKPLHNNDIEPLEYEDYDSGTKLFVTTI